ncbi:7,8-didemethyl-8-hydroxy-5-deazariboflavin synthase CofG [uncultured Amnibacterium sp.]|uniref:7,8-didemethyl-8-hydroxy-5-deazariboflavin synthase CofG n=1 Tax=uncultured Amnibacterium sp. TaxID=1631851 RepID=UPI0035CBFA2F
MTTLAPPAVLARTLDRIDGPGGEDGLQRDLSVAEAQALLGAQGEALDRLLAAAARLRDLGLARAGRPGIITYSRKVFLPITTLCRDRCHYCAFVDTPGMLLRKGEQAYMRAEQILAVARQGAARGCKEALFTLGDRPEERWPVARAWLDEHGYASTLEYVRAMALLVRQETGLLPHLNPGVMSAAELARLKPVAPSMGMMLETTSTRLYTERGQVHYGSPDKDPALRLQVIEDAGRARIPFTTGILVGIGESLTERAESLIALRDSHRRHGHVQEVIVQNFRAKPQTPMQETPDADATEYLAAIAVARIVLGPDMRIQVPPNLADPDELQHLLRAGADDWGGVSPLTADHVNPERPWPHLDDLAAETAAGGFALRERLTIHPRYIDVQGGWLDAALAADVLALADPDDLLATRAAPPAQALALTPVRRDHIAGAPAVLTDPVRRALSHAEDRPEAVDDADAAALLTATGAELDALAGIANDLRRYTVGEAVSYVVNRNIASSAFRADAAVRIPSLADLGAMVNDAWALGATEICMQGTVPAALPGATYTELAAAVKACRPDIHLHAFRPADVADAAARTGRSERDQLLALRDAGVDTMPGTGVKVLDETVRRRVAPADLPVEDWLRIVTTAHGVGLRSSSVLFAGLGESAAQRVTHLRTLAALQERTGGFTEFVPIPAGPELLVPGRSAIDEYRSLVAVSRLLLHGRIDHIQVAWTRLGLAGAPAALQAGADDLGGTLLDGAVLPEAGAEYGVRMTVADARRISRSLSRQLRQRTTVYGDPGAERRAAASA